MRLIMIKPVLNGYAVDCGCQTVVFTSKKALLTELSDYLDNPEKVEQRYLKEAINQVPGPVVEASIPASQQMVREGRVVR